MEGEQIPVTSYVREGDRAMGISRVVHLAEPAPRIVGERRDTSVGIRGLGPLAEIVVEGGGPIESRLLAILANVPHYHFTMRARGEMICSQAWSAS